MTNPETPEGMNPEVYRKLLEEYKQTIPEKLSTMKGAASKLKNKFNKEDLSTLRFVVHKTAGNAGTFGFPKVSDLCKTWDGRLTKMLAKDPLENPDSNFMKELDAFINEVEREFGSGR